MNNPADEIILHNYPQSPVAEKARVALGIKGQAWRDVEIPRLPPKPLLTQLTGGYRRTPVMQIGADIYCDSQCILRALEHRHPSPSFFPDHDAGLMWMLSRWTDGALFDLGVKIVLGSAADGLPQDFAEDRGRLYFGPDWAKGLKAANADLPHLMAQLRAPLGWAEQQMSDGRAFLLGCQPAAIDAQLYYVVWFLRGRVAQGPAFLSEFTAVARWEKNVEAIGHGTATPMTGQEAIARAKACTPLKANGTDPRDPQGLAAGMAISVSPDLDGGEQPVEGHVHGVSSDTISLLRHDPEAGDIAVHFPRAGYRVTVLDQG